MRIAALTILIIIFISTIRLYADTVFMKDKSTIKGLVVDEYIDRITLSTIDGEKDIYREQIEKIDYDTPEQNFMQLGRSYEESGQYKQSAFYYKKAMELNPDYKEAKDAYLSSKSKLWRSSERMTKKELQHREMVMDWLRRRSQGQTFTARDKDILLKKTLGFSLIERQGIFIINDIEPYCDAANAGIEEGDILVSIWGRHIRYSKDSDVIEELLGPKYSEVRIAVKKEISVPIKEDIKEDLYRQLGLLLGFEYEGLVVTEATSGGLGDRAGFKKGDFIIAIDGKNARYLQLDKVISLINSKRDKAIIFTITRTIDLRRRGE